MMNTRAICANRPNNHDDNQLRPNQSMIIEKFTAKKSKRNDNNGLQPRSKRSSVISSPNMNTTETVPSISPTQGTAISSLASYILIPGFDTSLQLPTKPFEAVVIHKWIQFYLKCLRPKIMLLMYLIIEINSKILQRYHSYISRELKLEYFCIVNSLIIQPNFKFFQRQQVNQIDLLGIHCC